MSSRCVAIIPARSGSKRIPKKNIKLLSGLPLICYSIRTAIMSEEFDEVVVTTDSVEIAEIAINAGASVPALRPMEYADDLSTDIDWMMHALHNLVSTPLSEIELVATLRPTSPLRTPRTISVAIGKLRKNSWADSLRAIKPVTEHPGKMWRLGQQNEAIPFMDQTGEIVETFNRPIQSLSKLWVQDASLEVARLKSVLENNSISGKRIIGFEMPEYEGLDLNTELDWEFLEFLLNKRAVILPRG